MKTIHNAQCAMHNLIFKIVHCALCIVHCPGVVNPRLRRGFSTLELLFVVSLISILIALLNPGVRVLHREMLKHRAKTELQSLAQALLNFQLAYGVLPFDPEAELPANGFEPLDVSLLLPAHNPRNIAFITLPQSLRPENLQNQYIFLHHPDPWGMPYHIHYRVDSESGSVTGFILVSGGPNKILETTFSGNTLSFPANSDDLLLQSY